MKSGLELVSALTLRLAVPVLRMARVRSLGDPTVTVPKSSEPNHAGDAAGAAGC